MELENNIQRINRSVCVIIDVNDIRYYEYVSADTWVALSELHFLYIYILYMITYTKD